jgi:hypothetical protein
MSNKLRNKMSPELRPHPPPKAEEKKEGSSSREREQKNEAKSGEGAQKNQKSKRPMKGVVKECKAATDDGIVTGSTSTGQNRVTKKQTASTSRKPGSAQNQERDDALVGHMPYDTAITENPSRGQRPGTSFMTLAIQWVKSFLSGPGSTRFHRRDQPADISATLSPGPLFDGTGPVSSVSSGRPGRPPRPSSHPPPPVKPLP